MSSNTRRPDVLRHEPEALTYARRVACLSKAELARRVGAPRSLITELEGGTRSATTDMLEKLAEVLGCPVVVLERKRVVV